LSPTRSKRNLEPVSFEAAFDELQRVVEQLEDGGVDLETALQLFNQGSQLASTCETLLDNAQLQVTRLTPESASDLPTGP
jgi:exodeoxyribonuclease VII small subunit